ncbi:MAG: ABC transporter permease [Thalassobaculaceae bacterium]|uniref:ABC transporter permease n=1 Tax=Roseitalea porphyridii TaxID=1852022 RepID=UPI0032F8D9E6
MILRFAAIKVLRALFTLWLVVTFVFVVLRLTGDPTQQLLPDDIGPEIREYYRAAWGLDRPLWEQYLRYFQAAFQGDFGVSFRNSQPALDLIWQRVPKTVELGLATFATAILLGIPLGVLAAIWRDSWIDRLTMSFAVFGFSMPNFFLGILLILLFALNLRLLPSSGYGTWQHMVMPVFTLATAFAGAIARFTRSAMLDVLSRDYMRTAEAEGASLWRRVWLHAFPNAAIPVVTIIGFSLGGMIGGAVVTENVFAWPGVGRLLTSSVADRDLAIVQGIVVMVAITMVSANLLVDLAYGWLDPRVRVGGGERGR